MNEITICLWFDGQAEEAAELYTSVFPDGRILDVTRYGSAGPGPEGSVMTVSFELSVTRFVGLNGGPEYSFSNATSFQIGCKSQAEVDHYWDRLSEGGGQGPCGWLTDRFGVPWQVVPEVLPQLLSEGGERSQRVMQAMLGMGKLQIDELERAAV